MGLKLQTMMPAGPSTLRNITLLFCPHSNVAAFLAFFVQGMPKARPSHTRAATRIPSRLLSHRVAVIVSPQTCRACCTCAVPVPVPHPIHIHRCPTHYCLPTASTSVQDKKHKPPRSRFPTKWPIPPALPQPRPRASRKPRSRPQCTAFAIVDPLPFACAVQGRL